VQPNRPLNSTWNVVEAAQGRRWVYQCDGGISSLRGCTRCTAARDNAVHHCTVRARYLVHDICPRRYTAPYIFVEHDICRAGRPQRSRPRLQATLVDRWVLIVRSFFPNLPLPFSPSGHLACPLLLASVCCCIITLEESRQMCWLFMNL
jgi:hypothetical protein